MIWPFKKREFDIEFVDSTHKAFVRNPVMRASDVQPRCYAPQKEKFSKVRFPQCPSMIDYARLGYIIPAWADIHILANKAGVSYRVGSKQRGSTFAAGRLMDASIIEGVLDPEDGVPLTVIHFGSPWSIFAAKGVSALIMPAIYHSDFLDDLTILPGAVDYDKFNSLNMICVPRRTCDIRIRAGDPLLHVIPIRSEGIKGGFGPASLEQLGVLSNQMYTGYSQMYRKMYQTIKKFTLSPTSKDTPTEL
jgi:hypothetical protein